MFLLDTNVITELRRPERADPAVVTWASTQPAASQFLSEISILEIELGARLVERKDGAHGASLRAWIHNQILGTLRGASSPSMQPWPCSMLASMSRIRAPNVMH